MRYQSPALGSLGQAADPCAPIMPVTSPGSAGPTGLPPTDPFLAAWDDTNFWAKEQLREHAAYLMLGLEDPALKRHATAESAKWEVFKRDRFPNTPVTREQAAATIAQARQMTMDLIAFKQEVLSRLNRGEWLGWLFPSFVDHIIREAQYFVRSLQLEDMGWNHNDPRLGTEENCFFLRIMAEHAIFAAHLLDQPMGNAIQNGLIRQAMQFAGGLTNLHSACSQTDPTLLALSANATEQLTQFKRVAAAGIKSGAVKSVIHPNLADHIIREGMRASQIMLAQLAARERMGQRTRVPMGPTGPTTMATGPMTIVPQTQMMMARPVIRMQQQPQQQMRPMALVLPGEN